MKRLLFAVFIVMLLSGMAFAGQAAQNTGCGLGTMIWKDSADNSSLFQAFQATTNGTSGNQTFGITTGTSECKQPSSFVKNEKLNQFVADNMDNLAKEIASGRGESLDTLAELMQVPTEQRTAFFAKLQANFAKIFASEKVEAADVIDNIYTL